MTHLSGYLVGRGLGRIQGHRMGMWRWGGGQRMTLLRLMPRSGCELTPVSYSRPGSPGTLCTLYPPAARSCWSPGWICPGPGTRLSEGSGETWRGADWSDRWTGRRRRPGGRRTSWPGSRGVGGSWGRGSGSREKCCGAGRCLCSPPARAESRAVMKDGTPGYLGQHRNTGKHHKLTQVCNNNKYTFIYLLFKCQSSFRPKQGHTFTHTFTKYIVWHFFNTTQLLI